jgi:anthranilate phosphoribosyltransferase
MIVCASATLQDGVALAQTIIRSGAAMDKLDRLIQWTNR